jgi:hypothetical protein
MEGPFKGDTLRGCGPFKWQRVGDLVGSLVAFKDIVLVAYEDKVLVVSENPNQTVMGETDLSPLERDALRALIVAVEGVR